MTGGLGALVTAAAAWPVFRFLSPVEAGEGAGQVSIPKEQVKVGSAHFFQFQGKPAVVLQPSPGEYVALSAVCTHLGCVISWQEASGEFLCPCHGGRFSAQGTVLGGPPPKALDPLSVALDGDQLKVG